MMDEHNSHSAKASTNDITSQKELRQIVEPPSSRNSLINTITKIIDVVLQEPLSIKSLYMLAKSY
jgi:hypothetical protein